ncbi:glycosyltransferase family 4 protein [Cupriavidus pauculus]|uniref:Glycosyl transferase n=1 Tax=Cupriavidus pauculus TaxID=82633 RepID=A0A2N5CHB1_9BURK|nr:glycosyltransferase family 4 protein [Cupriavidus pauculus]PLQ01555.1 glycosyl transferase [Cupriavidus pauculus]
MSAPPTICFLTGTLNAFAGAERMTAVIANALAERGYRVRILSLWDGASVFPLHPDVVHAALFEARPSFKRQYLATVAGIRQFVRQHQVDVLIEVDTMLTLFTLPATMGLKVRRIAWEHCHFDEDLGRRSRRVARWLAARFDDAVVVLTERDRRRWHEALRPRAAVVTIGNPLPFSYPVQAAAGTSRVVLAVGRLVHAKGFDLLLQAWAMLAPAFPDWRLVIVGDGDERATLENQIRSGGMETSVQMPGASTNIEAYYRDAAIFCLSSRYEGFGLVLLEAMAYGLPVVSTNCETGPRELVRNGENGLLVDTENPAAISTALRRLFADADARQALAEKGRETARERDVATVCGQWNRILDKQKNPAPQN